ncbi:hypothetical protein BJ085DRAFT_41627 [Dimargaris cristalligena]|uniref:WDR59/RTC1-like RING zinc finger domain-containing protein n=1 Tax=Dimargaris cristalligena TaxID=215637 RepID=A0A4P9ZLR5_9FUNG|nr:hypothetical protein BJ085DRAFT_41627 [Dimargaris cristalligena]|eukprot:RKP34093.1 hypothetical protein BJ085DRAFT_41627 [Dimargaris cristalligena]
MTGLTSPSFKSLKSLASDPALHASGESLYSEEADTIDSENDSGNENDFLTLPTLFVQPKTTRTSPDPLEEPSGDPFFPPTSMAAEGAATATDATGKPAERGRHTSVPGTDQSGDNLGNYVYSVSIPALSPLNFDLARMYQVHGHDPVALARANAGVAALQGRPDLVQTMTIVMYLLTDFSACRLHVQGHYLHYVDPYAPLFAPSLIGPYYTVHTPIAQGSGPNPALTRSPKNAPPIAQLVSHYTDSTPDSDAKERSFAVAGSGEPCIPPPGVTTVDLSYLGLNLNLPPTGTGDSSIPQAVQWGAHPLGRALVDLILNFYESINDIQTLCVLSCLLQQPFPPVPAWMVLNDRRTWVNQAPGVRPFDPPPQPHKVDTWAAPAPAAPPPVSATPVSRLASRMGPMVMTLPPPPAMPAFATVGQSPSGLTTPYSNQSLQHDYFGSRWATQDSGTNSTGPMQLPPPPMALTAEAERTASESKPEDRFDMTGDPRAALATGFLDTPPAIAAFSQLTGPNANRLWWHPPLSGNSTGSLSPHHGWIYPPIFHPLRSPHLHPGPTTGASRASLSPGWVPSGATAKRALGPRLLPPSNASLDVSPGPVSAGPLVGHFTSLPFPAVASSAEGPKSRRNSAVQEMTTQAPLPRKNTLPLDLSTPASTDKLALSAYSSASGPAKMATPTSPTSASMVDYEPSGSSVTTTTRIMNWFKQGPVGRTTGATATTPHTKKPSAKHFDQRKSPLGPAESMMGAREGRGGHPLRPTDDDPRPARSSTQGSQIGPLGRRRAPIRHHLDFLPTFSAEDQQRQLAHKPVSTAPSTWKRVTHLDDQMDSDYNPHWKPLLDPQQAAMFDHYRMMYAEILDRWGLQLARCEILKFLQTPKLRQLVYSHTTSRIVFDREVETPVSMATTPGPGTVALPTPTLHPAPPPPSLPGSTTCVVCRQLIKGTSFFCWLCGHMGHDDHIQQWFSKDRSRECPAGCGCHCFNLDLPSAVTSRIASPTRPGGRGPPSSRGFSSRRSSISAGPNKPPPAMHDLETQTAQLSLVGPPRTQEAEASATHTAAAPIIPGSSPTESLRPFTDGVLAMPLDFRYNKHF